MILWTLRYFILMSCSTFLMGLRSLMSRWLWLILIIICNKCWIVIKTKIFFLHSIHYHGHHRRMSLSSKNTKRHNRFRVNWIFKINLDHFSKLLLVIDWSNYLTLNHLDSLMVANKIIIRKEMLLTMVLTMIGANQIVVVHTLSST